MVADNPQLEVIFSFLRKCILGINLILSMGVLDDVCAFTIVFTGSAWLGQVYYFKWWTVIIVSQAIELCWSIMGPVMMWPLYRCLITYLRTIDDQGEGETRESFVTSWNELAAPQDHAEGALESAATTMQARLWNNLWGLYPRIHMVFYTWAFWVLLKDLRGEPRTWWGGSARRWPRSDKGDLEQKL